MSTCRRIQRLLAEDGPQVLARDAEAQAHVEGCEDCFAVLESLGRLDQALDRLPVHDAPDDLVAALLARPELAAAPAPPPRRPWAGVLESLEGFMASLARPRLMATAAAVLVAAVAIGVLWPRVNPITSLEPRPVAPARQAASEPEPSAPRSNAPQPVVEAKDALMKSEDRAVVGAESDFGAMAGEAEELERLLAEEQDADLELSALGYIGDAPAAPAESEGILVPEKKKREQLKEDAPKAARKLPTTPVAAPPPPPPAPAPPPKAKLVTPADGAADDTRGSFLDEALAIAPEPDEEFRRDRRDEAANEALGRSEAGRRTRKQQVLEPSSGLAVPGLDEAVSPAAAFLAERDAVDGLVFQEAAGYWANTYLPGDPALRLLEARLRAHDPASGLHAQARPAPRPFDPPPSSALAVYLDADRAALTGETRTLVRVGLQGALGKGGRRPAMSVAVVLDLGDEVRPEDLAAMRAVLLALAEAKDLEDRFTLFAGGVRPRVGADDFRFGPLTVAFDRLAEDSGDATLAETFDAAVSAVLADDDPTRPLGSSLVLLLTARRLGSEADALAERAHRAAVAGATVSTVGVGPAVDLAELDRLALWGQGGRRLLSASSEAASLVDHELAAASRVIARALRVNVRLAPGVRLVDVVGSERLDEAAAARDKEAEQAIDRRVERRLGIAADRGEDDDGIQVLVPSFYADTSHALLLDVVVPGPGPVADVTVRYKDLLRTTNGVARAHLELPRGEVDRGTIERGVLKDFLAHRLEDALTRAADRLAAGDVAAARGELATERALLSDLASSPGFAGDRDLERDVAMLDAYLALLDAGASDGLADSLRTAGRRKVLPPPA